MEIAIFAKKRTTQEGKAFYNYLTTLTKKDGSQITAAVKFRDDAGAPKPERCPMNVFIDKHDANLQRREYADSMGELREAYTLWVSRWEEGEPYVDTSLDDFI